MQLLKPIILLCAVLLSSVLYADLPIASNMQVMAPPPGAKVTAGYLTIHNSSGKALVITGASSASIPKIEIHESIVKNDVASMVKQDQLTVKAGQSFELTRGGFHLMLMGLNSPLVPGSSLQVTLHTNQGDIPLQMPVVKPHMQTEPTMKHNNGADIGAPEPNMNH